MNKYAVYERVKAEIARTAKSHEEYERRVKALAKKVKNLRNSLLTNRGKCGIIIIVDDVWQGIIARSKYH